MAADAAGKGVQGKHSGEDNQEDRADMAVLEHVEPALQFLPDTASKERPMEGTVLAAGPGRFDDNGKVIAMNVKAGDKVLFAKYSGTEFKVDDVEYLILSEKDILGIVQE